MTKLAHLSNQLAPSFVTSLQNVSQCVQMRPSATKCDQVRPRAITWGKGASGLTFTWQHSCGRIPVLCWCTQAHSLVTTEHSCICFGLGVTQAHLGMFGLFQRRLGYDQASPIMDIRLKHSCMLHQAYLGITWYVCRVFSVNNFYASICPLSILGGIYKSWPHSISHI